MEEDLRWKLTFDGRHLLMEDDIKWTNTNKNPQLIYYHAIKQRIINQATKHEFDTEEPIVVTIKFDPDNWTNKASAVLTGRQICTNICLIFPLFAEDWNDTGKFLFWKNCPVSVGSITICVSQEFWCYQQCKAELSKNKIFHNFK